MVAVRALIPDVPFSAHTMVGRGRHRSQRLSSRRQGKRPRETRRRPRREERRRAVLGACPEASEAVRGESRSEQG